MQAAVLAVLLIAGFFSPATASDTGTAAVNVVPAEGKHRGIVLKSQTVDTTIVEEQGDVYADTRVWLRLHNPASKTITVTVTIPGPQAAPAPLPADLDVRVNNAPLQLLPASGSAATGAIGVPARRSVEVTATFRQAFAENQGVVRYDYMLSGAGQWAGTPESLRLTLDFKQPGGLRSVLATAPPPHRSNPQSMTWDWEGDWAQAKPDIRVAFMAPPWFAEFDAAREATADDDASAAQHIALSQHYQRLASLRAPLIDAQARFDSRYYPMAIAELQNALVKSSTLEETARAHSMLAALYLQQAENPENDPERYLQAAADESKAASAPATGKSELLVAGLLLDDVTGAPYDGDRRWTREALTLPGGRQALAPLGGVPPLVSQTSVTVTTGLQSRQIVMRLGTTGDSEEAARLAQQTAEALHRSGPVQVVALGNTISVTLPGAPGTSMIELQKTVARALPAAPELALLHSVLADTQGFELNQAGLLTSQWTYIERADLGAALQLWEEMATTFESAQPAIPQGLSQTSDALVRSIQRGRWADGAAAWRRFAANSSVDYLFEDGATESGRHWQLQAGQTRDMFVQQSHWNSANLRWAVLALSVVLTGLAALVWRFS